MSIGMAAEAPRAVVGGGGGGAIDGAGGTVLESTLDTLMRCLELASNLEKPSRSFADGAEERSGWPHDQHQLSDDIPAPQVSLTDRNNAIKIVQYKDESQIGDIMRLITKDLSEPYSIYTYRYFIHNWPDLCLLAYDTTSKEYVGVVVCKVDLAAAANRRRGYIAMLAVDESCRRLGIGTRLVRRAIETMAQQNCDEVVLETEVSNVNAMRLYSNLGFIREKRLFRYYLNGVDAFRLKLFFSPPNPCHIWND